MKSHELRLHELRSPSGARKKRKRKGRGNSAGQGTYAGRGRKGQGARSGGGKGPYFEGGQLPLVRRLPYRRGFTNIWRVPFVPVNVDSLEERFQTGDVVTPEVLVEVGLAKSAKKPIKILGRGDISKALIVQAHAFSASAREKIEAVGGSVETLPLETQRRRR